MKHLKEYINESILSSTGSGLAGMKEDLKKWFIDGCLKTDTLINDVEIVQVNSRFDIVVSKKERIAKEIKNGVFLEITGEFGDLEKYLPMINAIRTENGKLFNLSFCNFSLKSTKMLPARCGKYINFENMKIDVFEGVPQGVWCVYFNHFEEGSTKVKSFVDTQVSTIQFGHYGEKGFLDCKLSDFRDCGVDTVGNVSLTREICGLTIYPNMFNTKNVYDKNDKTYLTPEATAELNELFENNKWKNGRGIKNDSVRVWNENVGKCTTIKFDEEKQVYRLTSNWLR